MFVPVACSHQIVAPLIDLTVYIRRVFKSFHNPYYFITLCIYKNKKNKKKTNDNNSGHAENKCTCLFFCSASAAAAAC